MSEVTGSELVGYFGFGSLVNRETLRTSYVDHFPAQLSGWRRHWQVRPAEQTITDPKDVVLLSIHRDESCQLNGVIVIDLAANLPLVDEREAGYSRVLLSPSMLNVPEGIELPNQVYVYVANPTDRLDAKQGVLLQSYLDAVFKGYISLFENEGLEHFVKTTTGFEREIIADRQNPIYPRSVEVTPQEAERFDQALMDAGVRFP